MDKDIVIKADGISKVYKLYNEPVDRLKEALHPFGKKYHRDFSALNSISFEIKKGENVAIIGENGAGKSTLLKILTGVLTPSSGSYCVRGNVFSLLELGAGFNPELTGVENLYFNGAVFGLSEKIMDKKIDGIARFADIGDFLHQPLKSYSSGMRARLAFALAVNVDPEVLIVDEVLSVGDMRFKQKCFREMDKFKNAGKTILLVTHNVSFVMGFSDRVIWLDKGEIKEIGDANKVAKKYFNFVNNSNYSSASDEFEILDDSDACSVVDLCLESLEKCETEGTDGVFISKAGFLFTGTWNKVDILNGGEEVSLVFDVESEKSIENPIVGFRLKDSNGETLLGGSSILLNKKLESFREGDKQRFSFQFKFPFLRDGQYSLSFAISVNSIDGLVKLRYVHDAFIFNVLNDTLYSKGGWTFLLKDFDLFVNKL